MRTVLAVAAGFLVIAGLVAGLLFLRGKTMHRSTPEGVGGQTEVVFRAFVTREPPEARKPMAEALVDVCRLRVDAERVEESVETIGDGVFRVLLEPGLFRSDQEELHGCLEDLRMQHLKLDVLLLRSFDDEGQLVTQIAPTRVIREPAR
jgi:hypothetical protein